MIRTSEVTVQTVKVEIQVVRIGPKQMTLAIFRQLPERELINHEGKLDGIPWGWINYECPAAYRHVIFTHEERLYRNQVFMSDTITVEPETCFQHREGHYRNPKTQEERPSTGYVGTDWQWVPSGRVEVLTGYWSVLVGKHGDLRLHNDWVTEAEAEQYRTNRLETIAGLRALEQLFIAA